MQIVDAQIHLWGSGLPINAAHRQVTAFTTDEALAMMDEAGVHAAIIHPPSWDPGSDQMAFDAVRDHPHRFAIMGALPLDENLSRERIASWRDQPGMLGLRYMVISEEDQVMIRSGQLNWLWKACEDANVPIALLATHSLAEIGSIAERHPGLRITIDHLGGLGGNTTLKDDASMTHIPALLALARHPNIAVKATGAPGYCSGEYPFASMHTHLHQIYDAFGPRRMFWGTDITKMPVSWHQCIEMFTDSLPWLRDEDKPLVMGQAICDWWGWDRKPSS